MNYFKSSFRKGKTLKYGYRPTTKQLIQYNKERELYDIAAKEHIPGSPEFLTAHSQALKAMMNDLTEIELAELVIQADEWETKGAPASVKRK